MSPTSNGAPVASTLHQTFPDRASGPCTALLCAETPGPPVLSPKTPAKPCAPMLLPCTPLLRALPRTPGPSPAWTARSAAGPLSLLASTPTELVLCAETPAPLVLSPWTPLPPAPGLRAHDRGDGRLA
jgi:hypothetical protein